MIKFFHESGLFLFIILFFCTRLFPEFPNAQEEWKIRVRLFSDFLIFESQAPLKFSSLLR